MVERLAVISDIHGNMLALQPVLADIAARGVDATVNLGGCVAGPLCRRETFEPLALAYDGDAAARHAHKLGGPKWAQALSAGRVE